MRDDKLLRNWWLALAVAALAACGSKSTDNSSTDPPTWTLEDLANSQGVSIRVPSFVVPAGHEEQSCYFMPFPDIAGGQDVLVNRIRLAMNVGSHHMNIFRVRTLIDLRPENGDPIKLGPYDATVVRGHDDY